MKKVILLLIVLLALSLRFFNLGAVPVGFHRDEAEFGYTTYSIFKTGRDVTGELLPIHISSFLHSPAGYSYLSIPFISFFGLNEFSVRFASALFGTLTVLMAYFLVKELFKNQKLALLSAFFLAISPWHINLSRVATENVVVVFCITLGVFLYLKWVKNNRLGFLLLSFFCFGITLFLYQAPRVFLPVFLPFLFVVFSPKDLKKNMLIPVVLFAITIIFPLLLIISSHTLTERIRMLSIFQHPATQLILDEQIREDGTNNVLFTRFFHNKIINYSEIFFSNYFAHFSYDFLLTDKGFPDRYRVPQMGLIYFFELPLVFFGLWKLWALDKRKAIFLSGWVLMAPIGSAFTFDDVPNLQRTLLIFPALTIVISYGFLSFWEFLQSVKFAWVFKIVMILIVGYGVLYYLHQYYTHQVNHRPWFRQEGYKALAVEINAREANYKKIVMTGVETNPAIFFLFYNKYDPNALQLALARQHKSDNANLFLGKYYFAQEPCPLHVLPKIDKAKRLPFLSGEKDVLYINGGNCPLVDKRAKILSEVKRSDGTVAFKLYTL